MNIALFIHSFFSYSNSVVTSWSFRNEDFVGQWIGRNAINETLRWFLVTRNDGKRERLQER